MPKALLVIDMQNICVGKNHAKIFNYDKDKLIKDINKKISSYDKNNVIYICNIMKKNFINLFAPFKAYEGSEEVKLVDALYVVNDLIIKKYSGNAFSNPELNKILKDKNIDELELVGVDGGGCVALTALGALKLGYKVTIPKSLVGTTFTKQADKYNIKLTKMGVIWKN